MSTEIILLIITIVLSLVLVGMAGATVVIVVKGYEDLEREFEERRMDDVRRTFVDNRDHLYRDGL